MTFGSPHYATQSEYEARAVAQPPANFKLTAQVPYIRHDVTPSMIRKPTAKAQRKNDQDAHWGAG